MARRLSFCCLLLFAFAGSAVAQNDPQYVIKRRTDAGSSEIHYLAHVYNSGTQKWELQDATTFNPNCVWYSGNTFDLAGVNHNYYFIDNGVYHFLYAPLTASSQLFLSDSLPSAQLLRNTEQNYYFWDWDWDNDPIDGAGLTRGIQRTGVSQGDCGEGWGGGECWDAFWVEYNGQWELSPSTHYTITTNAARFRKVTVTQHDITVTDVTEGQLGDLDDFTLDVVGASQSLSMTAGTYSYSYIPAYTTYVFEGGTHNYYNNTDYLDVTPDTIPDNSSNPSSYTWTITGPGAEFLSFSSTPGSNVTTFEGASSTLYYSSLNETGHKTATLTFTVTYENGITQVRTATVTVKTPCGNPLPVGNPEVVYDYVTVSWVNTADEYKIGLRKNETGEPWKDTIEVSNVSSYTFSGLEYETAYQYRVTAKCNGNYLTPPTESPYVVNFTTLPEPDLLVYGSVFGGGRMADVSGKTEVIIINCDTIGAVYGGNDIAGSVLGLDGSTIVLGVNQNTETNPDLYSQTYNGGEASTKVRVNDVYGGGNGYYSYTGTSFEAASSEYTSQTVAAGGEVKAMTQSNQIGDVVWTNEGNTAVTLTFPTIVKSAIKVTNDQVKVDSLFGGAKNAFLTHIIGYDEVNHENIYARIGDTIAINGGTILAVYGGNNIGGSQGYGRHRIHVTHTTTHLEDSIQNTASTGFGRDFGIRYLFGGGNKVAGSTTDVTIIGGQLDTIFGGGNEADVYAANIEVNCELGAHTGDFTFGNTYTSVINPDKYLTGIIADTVIDTINYKWDGLGGIYNVRTLFGGSNQAAMNGVPTVRLTSGSIGTVYGGGNAGDMLSHRIDSICLADDILRFKYGTHVVMNSPTVLVDYLYGGCQVSNVDFSTWVEIQNGRVGYVYGGCNVSGDVGSTLINTDLEAPDLDDPNLDPEVKRTYFLQYQQVQGATYVVASGGVIYKNLFAGSNGYYHCNDNVSYIQGTVTYGDPEGKYLGLTIPTHNETHAVVRTGANVKGNVYAGGNLACVGFTTQTVGNSSVGYKPFPSKMVGLASVRMDGGTVKGDVYGGGNMASVFGSDEVQVSGGTIGGALYGGNDKLGMVANPTNRALPDKYFIASDGNTPLTDVKTYVGVTGRPKINTVYGGGNGDYVYTSDLFCDPENLPIQRDIFVDINIDGYPDEHGNPGGHINTVYGGGNGVTVLSKTTVFLNVNGRNGGEPDAYDHVDTIYGGNNKGHLNLLADIILLKGQVNTVYGGCNKGAMIGSNTVTGIDNTEYTNVGSVVRLRDRYTVTNTVPNPHVTTTTKTTGRVSGTVYGGCRMNGVSNNSLVLVEGGIHGKTVGDVFQYATIYAGSDISGDVGGLGQVVISNGTYLDNVTQVGDVYGGGNGNYTYTGAYQGLRAPYCDTTHVEIKGGTVNNLYAGGYAGQCGGTTMQVDGGTVNNRVFGGGNMAGLTTSNYITTTAVDTHGNVTITTDETTTLGSSTVTVNGGQVKGGIFGGDNLADSVAGPVNVYIYGGTLGSDADHPMADGIFGGGYGVNTGTLDDVTVTIGGTVGDQSYAPTIYGDVYGGSALGQVNGPESSSFNLTKVDFLNGNLYGKLYGGGMGNASDSALVNGNVQVNISNGNLYDDIYGGCNVKGGVTGDIVVNVNGGTVGTTGTTADVFGGGYGHSTATSGDVTVNFGALSTTHTDAPTLYGDLYGGSGYGNVNNSSSNSTTVNVLNGYVKRDVYGGGLGDASNPAAVNGKVFVNIGTLEDNTLKGKARIDGSVYGCNNVNGSPQDDVLVNIYATHHWDNNFYPTNPPSTVNGLQDLGNTSEYFALRAVYGGGNKAHYIPAENKMTTVHVWGCRENTIEDLYGGGNAADVGIDGTLVVNTRLIVDGGRINRSFGGGNGYSQTNNHTNPTAPYYNPGANIFGTATSQIHAGLINEVYGGANMKGTIDVIDLNVLGDFDCDKVFGKVFGCANAADINHSITTTMGTSTGCSVFPVGELYGGSNQAYIGNGEDDTDASVTLNVYGGNYESVFGGSKGVEGTPAPIYGKVFLNLYGGTIKAAYGGTDYNGNIYDTITVVVDEKGNCPLELDTVFGAGRTTIYKPNKKSGNELITSPIVFVKNGTVKRAVYGGGKGSTATTTANPLIIIGDTTANSTNLAQVGYNNDGGYVFGGGYAGVVKGGPTVNVGKTNTMIVNSVFGGGDEASIDSTLTTTVNIYDGTIRTGIYGGCNTRGTVKDNIAVNIYGGTLGTADAKMVEGIFGGGKGHETYTDDNITVTIGDGTNPSVYADVYGGSAFGEVGAAGKLAKVDLKNGTVYGKIFGGGKGDGTHSATVTGNAELAINGSVLDSIFGGCNVNGVVKGNTLVNILDNGVLGAAAVQSEGGNKPEIRANVYGGGLGQNTKVKGDVDVTVNGSSAIIYGDVYGGSAKGLVNCTEDGEIIQNDYAKTNTTLKSGIIHGSLYGGGHGIGNADAHVYGPVTVSIEGGEVINVFGCNNTAGAPLDTVAVYVTGGIMDSVFGGGNVAAYTAPYVTGSNTIRTNYPFVHVSGGDVRFKVAGGGNAANITGNPYILVSNSQVGQTTVIPTIGTATNTNKSKGIYGGCNTSGNVNGNTLVDLIGGNIGVSATNTANIHGGGYGAGTNVTGNVTVNYGEVVMNTTSVTPFEEHTVQPVLYGALYGGSALGHVNTNNTDNLQTIVNLMNGTIIGEAYGGGLGDATHAAIVYGVVHVNVGAATDIHTENTFTGMADLVDCHVYGGNNLKGSPKKNVYVDVYKTYHIQENEYGTYDGTWAVDEVFGGGNRADYNPDAGLVNPKAYVYVHMCSNTIRRVFGGGNAAYVPGVDLTIDGGRFDEVYGGGNGELGQAYAANVGTGGIHILLGGGRIRLLVNGSNDWGDVLGTIISETMPHPYCTETVVEDYFLGNNHTELNGDIDATIYCGSGNGIEMKFVNLYCGSNLAQINGNINVTVEGGVFDHLYGGSKGDSIILGPSHSNYHSDINGNVNLIITGGTIGELYGGCDVNGNITGRINIEVYQEDNTQCPLFIGDIYGAGNETNYSPTNANLDSPKIMILKGEIGGHSNSLPVKPENPSDFDGDVFGGGNFGAVTSNPKVIVGDGKGSPVTINGNVFGGGHEGNVNGSSSVIVIPTTHSLTINPGSTSVGAVRGYNSLGEIVSSPVNLGEDLNLRVKAIPSVYAYRFNGWNVQGTGSSVNDPTSASTYFTMGTADSQISANFVEVPQENRHTLTVNQPSEGNWITVEDGFGVAYNGLPICEGAVLYISVQPVNGYVFAGWTVEGEGASVGSLVSPTTTFTMGTENATLTATFRRQRSIR